jgi:arsenical pump membrane protein
VTWALSAASGLFLTTGLLPVSDARTVLLRIWPIVLFLAAVTVVAELADAAGLFELAADLAARAGRGRVLLLWLLVVLLATVTTVLLSLDTTAVLLTPVVLALAERLGLAVLPFAMTTIWLANTASLLLPVSNLTNLLAQPAAVACRPPPRAGPAGCGHLP